jgi:hypothetical protein
MYRVPLAFLCTILLVACSDDNGSTTPDATNGPDQMVATDGPTFADSATPNPDGAVPHDGSGPADQGTPGDATPPQGDGSTALSCTEVSDCSDSCAVACNGNLACMMACPTNCNKKGCASAQPLFTAVNQCVTTKCFLDCMGGPSTGCKNCVNTKCAAEVAACNAQSC